ncbi:CBS domain-containing protein [Streptomyces sp. S.PB5]|uniref:CBS domain-containing protein n=1 Tax=Streptomyces sp. S.PB5 TaxID=3020844 RepID=UPI0025B01888|nr:CBS domain-containing protein [Streptomyces sp. S.PB5]MDN3027924.1 CBS domain-containing protein [Streptomyces sp. S.PB5]
MLVRHIMSGPPVTVPPTESVRDVALTMRALDAGYLFVVGDDSLVGVVTDRDLVNRVLATGLSAETRVEAVMTGAPASVDADADVMAAYRIMRDLGVRRVPVLSERRLVGVVTFDDVFRLATQELDGLGDVVDIA